MCGIAGHLGLSASRRQRFLLVRSLGSGVDTRGGHASGCFADGTIHKWAGKWSSGPARFLRDASDSGACIMHARWATCGNASDPTQAHPFKVSHLGRTIVGVHNGVFSGTKDTAKERGRKHTVDSLEFYRLLVAGELDAIAGQVSGYGALCYTDTDDEPGSMAVNLVRLTATSSLVLYSIESGGYVWASTRSIALEAIFAAGLTADGEYEIPSDGVPIQLRLGGAAPGVWHMTNRDPVKLCQGSPRAKQWWESYRDVADYDDYTSTGRWWT